LQPYRLLVFVTLAAGASMLFGAAAALGAGLGVFALLIFISPTAPRTTPAVPVVFFLVGTGTAASTV
jgi:hypothetical protein